MKILALEYELPGAMAGQFQELAKAEARRVWELYQAGLIRELYFRADRDEAVLVLECASFAEAEKLLATLPFAQAALIGFEIVGLKAYPGFARLFASGEMSGGNSS